MDFLKSLIGNLLNPRSKLEKLYRMDPETEGEPAGSAPMGARGRRLRSRDVILNLPFMLGSLIVLGLFLIALFGPLWAPKNPYIAGQHIVPHYDFDRQEYIRPPLPPSSEFPLGTDRWGNDLLSLMMHGARNTLVACAFITMVRVTLGLVLGGLAGWNEGKAFDHLIMGIVVVITSIPTLISSTILIYALDIRRGLLVFIIALSVIGWAEIAQYIRSEFLVLRKMPYIEGARSTGLNGLEMAVRHVLPNVLPQLLVITFLEMGAVMMLLGELGFIGVFIGGGSQTAMYMDPAFDNITVMGVPDVPEWGVILAEGFRWLRSKPFVVIPPATAFFISVLGFNALGEGLRRLIEQSGISTGFLLRKRMILVFAAISLATVFIMNNTGPAPWYTKVADAFNGDLAYEHVQALTEMEGRAAWQEGGEQAAAYIAERFESYGLEPGWKNDTFIYPLETQLVQPLAQPYLAVMSASGEPIREFQHQIDFGFVIEGHGGSGDVQAPLTFVGFQYEAGQYDWESFKGLDVRDRIVILFQGNAPAGFATEALIRGARGVLWVADEGRDDVRSQVQLADASLDYLSKPNLPIYRIRPVVADAIVAQGNLALPDLLVPDGRIGQSGPGWFTKDLDATVRMSLALSEPQAVEIPCVLGYKFGSDFNLSGQLIVLFANYDGLGIDPDGTIFPAANHSASSVGLLLELARLWQEQNIDARRSVLFIAWGGGQLDNSGAREFLSTSRNYPRLSNRAMYGEFSPAIIIQPDYVGAGGDSLFIHQQSDDRLVSLLTDRLTEAGVSVVSEQDTPLPHDELVASRRTLWLHFTWSDPDTPPDQDAIERIEAEKLQAIGEAFSLALTTMVRESSY